MNTALPRLPWPPWPPAPRVGHDAPYRRAALQWARHGLRRPAVMSAAAPVAAGPGLASPAEAAGRAERDTRLAGLVQAAARGDNLAFESFYEATFAYARTLARRVLRGAPDAAVEDLLADAYFEAWRLAARFDAARGSAVSWLLTIVKSRAVDALRSRAAHPAVPAAPEGAPAEDAHDAFAGTATLPAGADPSEHLWRAEAGTRLHAALGSLAPGERWVLGLAYFRELSHAEIATATGLPLGTVKSHALRAQRKLRAVLAGLQEAV